MKCCIYDHISTFVQDSMELCSRTTCSTDFCCIDIRYIMTQAITILLTHIYINIYMYKQLLVGCDIAQV